MAIALVQSAVTHGGATSPKAYTFSATTTNLNMLSLWGDFAVSGAGAISTITDDGGNTWTFSTSAPLNQNPPFAEVSSDTVSFAAWTLGAAPANTITITYSQIVFNTVGIAEWSGVGSIDSAGMTAQAITNNSGTTASQAVTLSASGELVLLAANAEFHAIGSAPSQGTVLGGFASLAYALPQSGAQTYTWGGITSGDNITTITAAFQPPSAAISGQVQSGAMTPPQRRKLARAVVRFTPVVTTNAHGPNGAVQPVTARAAPRRKPARAVVRFTPVTTVNTHAATVPQRAQTPDSGEAREFKRWLLMEG